jgi:pimeloyl-ACP methyl ester carboxylesterase
VCGVFFFGCNMGPSGTKAMQPSPVIDRCFSRHAKDYAQLSATPDAFQAFVGAVSEMMKTEPNYTAADLAKIRVPVAIVQGASDQYGTMRQIEIAQEECYCPVDVTMIDGAGHSLHREAPEATLAAVSEFANRILRVHEGAPARAA